jgi:hypothetical protein
MPFEYWQMYSPPLAAAFRMRWPLTRTPKNKLSLANGRVISSIESPFYPGKSLIGLDVDDVCADAVRWTTPQVQRTHANVHHWAFLLEMQLYSCVYRVASRSRLYYRHDTSVSISSQSERGKKRKCCDHFGPFR